VLRGDGNLRITTLAEYLFALGFELDINLVMAGEPRRAELEGRAAIPTHMAWNATLSMVFMATKDQEGYFSLYTAAQPVQMRLFPRVQQYWEFHSVPNSTSGQIIVGELVGD
jgi:hypothetical protein